MIYREATIQDIPQIQIVRNLVKENTLSNPNLVTNEDCIDYITRRGKGWVCEINKQIVGFSIVDILDKNIWALFLNPEFEKQGIGKKLHAIMLDWYFEQTKTTVWLSTTPNTRADGFYRNIGWTFIGAYGKDEIKLEMTYKNWKSK